MSVAILDPLDTDTVSATDGEREVIKMVRRHLIAARQTKASGSISFKVALNDGGITKRVVISEINEK